jgi:hypothetical protein
MKVLNMTHHFKFISGLFAVCCLLFLSGCSTLRVVESQVQTNTQWPAGAANPSQALYRLERLPADANNMQAGWAEVELEPILAGLGWKRNDVDAKYSVWIGVQAAEYVVDIRGRIVPGPWLNLNIGNGYRPRGVGVGVGLGWTYTRGGPLYPGMRTDIHEPPIYVREVSILIRDLQTGQVVYQTKASHDGPWSDHQAIWRAMIPAALQGFPNPAQVKRRVDVTIPR